MWALPMYNTLSLPILINGYINIVIVIARIIPNNPKPLSNVYAFNFILETINWKNKVI